MKDNPAEKPFKYQEGAASALREQLEVLRSPDGFLQDERTLHVSAEDQERLNLSLASFGRQKDGSLIVSLVRLPDEARLINNEFYYLKQNNELVGGVVEIAYPDGYREAQEQLNAALLLWHEHLDELHERGVLDKYREIEDVNKTVEMSLTLQRQYSDALTLEKLAETDEERNIALAQQQEARDGIQNLGRTVKFVQAEDFPLAELNEYTNEYENVFILQARLLSIYGDAIMEAMKRHAQLYANGGWMPVSEAQTWKLISLLDDLS